MDNSGEPVSLSGFTITGGNAIYGGGILNNGTLTVTDSTFSNNSISGYGQGGGICNMLGTLTVINSTFTDNSAPSDGGGVCNIMGTLTMTNCTFTNNSSYGGGGIFNQGILTVTNNIFTDNSASYQGGGIFNDGTLTVTNSAFTNNTAEFGGGIFNGLYFVTNEVSNSTVSNSTFNNNTATFGGGGIYNAGTLTVTNSTFTNNTNTYEIGGGISNDGTLTLTNCTISDNTVGGGVYNDTSGSLTLNNTIVAGNVGVDISGQVQPNSKNNLIGDGTGISNLTQLDPSNLIGTTADPINSMLGALANNGGPTETMALLPGSPAIDAGSNALAVDANGDTLTTDQRGAGFPRIINGTVDIGAYESSYIDQAISFGPLANQTYGVAPITLTATAASHLPVSYTVISGLAIISGDVLTVTGTGNVDVEADQAGNTTYNAATPVDESFTVAPAPLTVSSTNESMTYGGTAPTLTYTYTGVVNSGTSPTFSGSLATTATSSSNVGGYPITQGTLAATGNYTINTFNPGTLTVIAAPLTVTATNESMTYGGTVPVLGYTYTGLVNKDTSATFTGSLVSTATSSSNVGGYPITQGTLAATGNYMIGTYNPITLSIAKDNAIVVVTPYSVVYNGAVHTATGIATGINGVSLNGLVVYSTHTNAGSYTDTWTFTDTTGNYIDQTGTDVDTIAKANAIVVATPYTVVYNGVAHTATGAAYGINDVALAGLNLINTVHVNAGTYTDIWTFSNPNYNNASGIITDTIIKANANVSVVGYNTFYNALPHAATGAAYGVNGAAVTGLNLNSTVHTNVGYYTDTWTFADTTGNYNNASGTVVDTITPSKSKMVRETVLVPRTTVVKATVLVPVVKEVKVVERVKVGNKWVNKTVLVPETVLVKKTVLVNETKMTKKTEMVKVYY